MAPKERSDLFRRDAIDYHLRDPESSGIIGVRPRWTWPVIAVALILVVATAAYVLLADDVVHALLHRLLS